MGNGKVDFFYEKSVLVNSMLFSIDLYTCVIFIQYVLFLIVYF